MTATAEPTIHERIQRIITDIEHVFGLGHPLATAVVDQAVENGQVTATEPNPEPGQIAQSIAPVASATKSAS